MATDEAILESFIERETLPTVRIYRWAEKCVTIGRHQDARQARGSYPAHPVFRRPTGGRAVVHGDDLIVSVIASENALGDDQRKGGILASYWRILGGVVDTIESFGVVTATGLERRDRVAVDCFASLGRCDVIDIETGTKIVGCAQRRTRGAILQQMSIRQHERYHILSEAFVTSLKVSMARCLAVDDWNEATRALPSEDLRCSRLLGSMAKGAECGTKNSDM